MELTKNPPWLVEVLEAALADSDATRRKMFGSLCAFAGGNLACGLFGSNLFVRLSEADRARLLALPGAEPFDPMGGRPMREYAVVPPSMLEEAPALQAWVGRALEYAADLPPKPASAKARKSAPAKAWKSAPAKARKSAPAKARRGAPKKRR